LNVERLNIISQRRSIIIILTRLCREPQILGFIPTVRFKYEMAVQGIHYCLARKVFSFRIGVHAIANRHGIHIPWTSRRPPIIKRLRSRNVHSVFQTLLSSQNSLLLVSAWWFTDSDCSEMSRVCYARTLRTTRYVPTSSVRVTYRDVRSTLPGHVTTVVYTTCRPTTIRSTRTCSNYRITSRRTVPGKPNAWALS